MDKQNLVVTFDAPSQQKAQLLELLGSEASLTFLNELSSAQRERALRQAAENVKHFLKGEKVMGIAQHEEYL
jgi:hypothetical protein